MAKTTCPVSRKQFAADAKHLTITAVGENDGKSVLFAMPKEFSTGSLGWYGNGKAMVLVGGSTVEVQVGYTLTIIGSKELLKDTELSK